MPTRKDISSGSKVPTRNDVEGWRHWQTCARQGHNRQHQVAERDVAAGAVQTKDEDQPGSTVCATGTGSCCRTPGSETTRRGVRSPTTVLSTHWRNAGRTRVTIRRQFPIVRPRAAGTGCSTNWWGPGSTHIPRDDLESRSLT